ncbi:MAG TPA: TraB/GumN family protein [Nitrospiria bacterium]
MHTPSQFKNAGLLFVSLLLLSCAGPRPATQIQEKHFLWEAAGPAGTVFLLGSIHVAKKELYPLPDVIEGAFAQADTLVVEINPLDSQSPQGQMALAQRGVYPAGTSLRAQVSAETYEKTRMYLAERDLGVDLFDRFRPWFVALTLTMAEAQRLGFDPRNGIDIHFLGRAAGRKRILELETFEQQIALFEGLSEREQELYLVYTLEDMKLISSQMDRLMRAWTEGDAASVEALLKEGLAGRPDAGAMYDRWVDRRNDKMAEKIEGYLKTGGNYFVVVGAGHLIGERGLIRILEAKGHAVRQL